MNKPSPLKRDENLVLLSRDHHDGLLTVWKVRQGLKNNTPGKVLATFILHQYSNHLEPHFLEEEKWVFPTLNSMDELRMKAEDQHADIRKMISDIGGFVDDESTSNEVIKDCFEKFGNLLEEHIRFEERMLFPHIEQTISEVEMENIGHQLSVDHHEKKSEPWADEFWARKPKNIGI